MSLYPKISIVTTNYNYGHFLEETILSVVSQNYPNLEYIIIDGGSTDRSVEVIQKYESHLAYWISEPDFGQANGINKGFRKCTGEIVGFLNSDDLYKPETFKTVASLFEDAGASWIGSSIDAIDEVGHYLQTNPVSPFRERINWVQGLWFPQPSSFWRRNVMEQVGLLDEALHYCFDQEYWARLRCAGYEPLIWDQSLSIERHHVSRKTFDPGEKCLRERLYIYHKYLSHLSGKDCRTLRETIRAYERQIIRQPIYEQAKLDKKSATRSLLSELFYHPDLCSDRATWGLLKSLVFN